MPRAQSIHVGVNDPRDRLDTHEHDTPPVLQHSEETAWRMAEVAGRAGYGSILVLRGSEATCQAVDDVLAAAARSLAGGDTLFVSFSGHGKRVRDLNEDEGFGWDEAWCLHDGILLDDKLAGFWRLFKPEVRIVVVAENCFGGGGMRGKDGPGFAGRGSAPPPGPTAHAAGNGVMARSSHGQGAESWTSRGGGGPALGTPRGGGQVIQTGRGEAWGRGAAESARTGVAEARKAEPCIPAPPDDADGIRASLLFLAASCEDEQPKDGLYAHHLLAVWNGGLFEGSYCELHRRVSERVMSEGAPRPQISMLGAPDLDFQMEPAFHRKRKAGAEEITPGA
jgi:hypothetical protein